MFEEVITQVCRALLDGEAILVPNRMDMAWKSIFAY